MQPSFPYLCPAHLLVARLLISQHALMTQNLSMLHPLPYITHPFLLILLPYIGSHLPILEAERHHLLILEATPTHIALISSFQGTSDPLTMPTHQQVFSNTPQTELIFLDGACLTKLWVMGTPFSLVSTAGVA